MEWEGEAKKESDKCVTRGERKENRKKIQGHQDLKGQTGYLR